MSRRIVFGLIAALVSTGAVVAAANRPTPRGDDSLSPLVDTLVELAVELASELADEPEAPPHRAQAPRQSSRED